VVENKCGAALMALYNVVKTQMLCTLVALYNVVKNTNVVQPSLPSSTMWWKINVVQPSWPSTMW